MQVIEGHKGWYRYSVHFTGLEGHGSAPERGVNAVEYARCAMCRGCWNCARHAGRAPLPTAAFEPPWTTINTGALVGGVAHNVIAGKARIGGKCAPPSDAELVKSETRLALSSVAANARD